MRWGDHIVWGRSLSGKPREEERLHPGFVGLVRLRCVHMAGEEVRFQPSRLGAQQEQRCRSWSCGAWTGNLGKVSLTTAWLGERESKGAKMKQRGPQVPG